MTAQRLIDEASGTDPTTFLRGVLAKLGSDDDIEEPEIVARAKKAGLDSTDVKRAISKMVSSGDLKRSGSWLKRG